MNELRTVALFCEDTAHERFASALVRRVALEVGVRFRLSVVSGRGGHGTAVGEFVAFQRVLLRRGGTPDLVLVVIDANCAGWNEARKSILSAVEPGAFARVAIGCPDPHVERWFLADPASLHVTLGVRGSPGRRKCDRDHFKQLLVRLLLEAGQTVTLGGAEFADEIVSAMDLYKASKAEPSLADFIGDLRSAFKTMVR